jgi:hypothetical protein
MVKVVEHQTEKFGKKRNAAPAHRNCGIDPQIPPMVAVENGRRQVCGNLRNLRIPEP